MSVQDLSSDPETTPEPDERIMRRLVRALNYSKGFWLGFAKSNTPAQRRRLAALCKDLLEPLKIRVLEIEFNESITDLLPILRERLAQETAAKDEEKTTQPKLAIFVHGLERSIPSREAYPPLLSALNLKRELFRQEVPHPLLLWLPDYALTALARKAPDFWAWRSGLYEFAPERDAAEQSLKAVRGEAIHVTDSLPEQAKRERLVMLKGLLDDYRELSNGRRDQEARANILNEIGSTYEALGEWLEAKRAYEESLTIARSLKDSTGEALALHYLGRIEQDWGKVDKASYLFNEGLKIARGLGDQHYISVALQRLGWLAQQEGNFAEARRLYEQQLELSKSLNNQRDVAITMHLLGMLTRGQGDFEEAASRFDESLKITKRLGDQYGIARTLYEQGFLAQLQGDVVTARRLYKEGLEISERLGDWAGSASTLHQLGVLAAKEGDKEEAARLYREALSIFERIGSPNAGIVRRTLTQMEGQEDFSD